MRRVVTDANTPFFRAEEYSRFRPLYPAFFFERLSAFLPSAFRFADIGCGGGQSTESLLAVYPQATGAYVDSDEKMVKQAKLRLPNHALEPLVARAEDLPLEDRAFDLVLVGSAIHWFDREHSEREFRRVIRPGGYLFVFEYQFPKCIDEPKLEEWTRRKFNTEWKAPIQKPRGRLRDLLDHYVLPNWVLLFEDAPQWLETMGLDSFLEHLYSQSRYLHAEKLQENPERYRESIRREISHYFEGGPLKFDLKPRSFFFRKTAG